MSSIDGLESVEDVNLLTNDSVEDYDAVKRSISKKKKSMVQSRTVEKDLRVSIAQRLK